MQTNNFKQNKNEKKKFIEYNSEIEDKDAMICFVCLGGVCQTI